MMGDLARILSRRFDEFPLHFSRRILLESSNTVQIDSPQVIESAFLEVSTSMDEEIVPGGVLDEGRVVASSLGELALNPYFAPISYLGLLFWLRSCCWRS